MNKAVVGGLVALFLGAAPALAATIDVGNHELFENMANQQIQISVIPGDPPEEVAGMDLFAQIADGGPDIGVGGSHIDGPEFTSADMETGTIWIDPVPTPNEILPGGQVIVGGVVLRLPGAVVEPNGLVVTLTIDTTGFFHQDARNPWELKLIETLDPSGTALLDNTVPSPRPIPLVINNGTIHLIVPEPSTVLMLASLLAAVPLLAWARRRRR